MKGIAKRVDEILTQLQYLHFLVKIICSQNDWKCYNDTSYFNIFVCHIDKDVYTFAKSFQCIITASRVLQG